MNVLIRRRSDGIGDWLFLLACIKHYNKQRPGVRFYVDFELPQRERVNVELSPLVLDAFKNSDVVWYEPVPGQHYDATLQHVVYQQRSDVPYVESMLAQLVSATGMDVAYDPECLPKFIYPELADRPRKYIATVSKGKAATAFKDWGRSRFDELASQFLACGYDIAQLGLTGDPRLASATSRWFGCSFDTVCGLLAGARLFVGLENGISVLASWLGTPTIVVYGSALNTEGGKAINKARRWCGPAIACMVRAEVADVLVVANKELKC
jgi:ADP-heptose:LPS heptosyltransferase